MQNEAEFDRFADAYYQQHRKNIAVTGEEPSYFSEYKIRELKRSVAELNVAARDLLDFGCGVGNSVEFFRSYFPNSALACADVSAKSIEISQRRFPGSERYLHIGHDRIPCRDESFDVVFSACVFHHIDHESHAHWLQELSRITRPGGLLTIFEHNPLNPLTVRAVNTCPFDVNARLIGARQFKQSMQLSWSKAEVDYHVFFPRALASLRRLEAHLKWLPLGAQYSISARKR